MRACRNAAAGAFVLICLRSEIDAGMPGILDDNFNPNVPAGSIYATVIQPDGKILLGGVFAAVGGKSRNNIARLNSDGSLENTSTFNAGEGVNGRVNSIALQADGKILLAGDFTAVNNQPRNRIARLNPDGSLESTGTFNAGTGADAFVRSVVLQADSKILIAGEFSTVNGQARRSIARLLANGTLESLAGFNPGVGPDDGIHSLSVRPDGKLLVWGRFDHWNNQPHNRIVRLNPNGLLEAAATFDPGTAADNWVWSIAVQPDERILVGGEFLTMNGQPRTRLARLNANGSVESLATFNPGTGTDSTIRSIAVQTDGKILIAGLFTSVNGQPRNRIARLHSDGRLESTATFNAGTGADEGVSTLALQTDGRIVIGGAFSTFDGEPRNAAARLWNDAATESLGAPTSSSLRWNRGGTSPEIEDVTFDVSTDGGAGWSPLGKAVRIPGGWQRVGLSLPSAGHLRARGRTTCGLTNGSSGRIETTAAFSFLSPLQTWRQTHFGTTDNTGNAANNADPDMDTVENLLEFAFGLHPSEPNQEALPAWEWYGSDYVMTFARPAENGVSYIAEFSTALTTGDWTAIPNSDVTPNFTFHAPVGEARRLFLRLRITVP